MLSVWRGFLFHGFMEWGFMCGCWFQGLVWPPFPWTALHRDRPPLDHPSHGPPFPWTAQNFALFFFPLPPQNSFFSSLSGCLLVEFWWCLKARTLKCARLEFSGCRVKPRRPRSRRGFTRQPENSKRAHLSAPALQTPPKFNEKTPREGKKERILWREREKKSAKFWAPHPSGPHPSGPHFLWVWAPHPSAPALRAPTFSGCGAPSFGPPPLSWVWAPGLLKKNQTIKNHRKQLKKSKQLTQKIQTIQKQKQQLKKIQTINFKHLKP